MKAIFAYNYTKRRPVFGGPTSAFTPYKIKPELDLPPIVDTQNKRKEAFRKIKAMFGLGSDFSSAPQK